MGRKGQREMQQALSLYEGPGAATYNITFLQSGKQQAQLLLILLIKGWPE